MLVNWTLHAKTKFKVSSCFVMYHEIICVCGENAHLFSLKRCRNLGKRKEMHACKHKHFSRVHDPRACVFPGREASNTLL